MLNTKTLAKLILVTLVCAIPVAYLATRQPESAIKGNGTLFLPNLLKDPDHIKTLVIQDHTQTLTVQRNAAAWQILEKNNFSVLHDKVEELLFGLADMRIVEPKTSNPDLLAQLDLNDSTEPASKAITITVLDAAEQELAKVVVGKRESLRLGEEFAEHIFIRNASEQQAWLVQGMLPISNDFHDWVEQPLLSLVDVEQIKSVHISQANGQKVAITKNSAEQEDFILENAQPKLGMVLDIESINTLPFKVAELEFNDVTPAKQIDLDWAQSTVAELQTFAGVTVVLNVLQQDDHVYGKVHATVADTADDDLKQQVAKYNANSQTWYYSLPAEFYQAISVSNDDLLKVEEPVIQDQAVVQK